MGFVATKAVEATSNGALEFCHKSIGEAALPRGMPFYEYALPDFGVPAYSAIGPVVARPVVYAVAHRKRV